MDLAGNRIARCGMSAALALALAAGASPSLALANEANAQSAYETASESTGALDPALLEDGTYSVAVSAKKASDVTADSMMGSAVVSPATITVKDGACTVVLNVSGIDIDMMGMTGTYYATNIKYYPDGVELSGTAAIPTGEAVPVDVLAYQEDSASNPAQISFALPESALTNGGYAAVSMEVDGISMMGVQNAVLAFDWSTLQEVSEGADKTALDEALAKYAAIVDDGSVDYKILAVAAQSAQAVSDDAEAEQSDVDDAAAQLVSALSYFEGNEFAYQEGWLYSVGIDWFSAEGADYSRHLSMFGDAAIVEVVDGSAKVQLTATGSMASMITGMTYGDADTAAEIVENDDGSRTFTVWASTSKASKVTFDIAGVHSGMVGYLRLDADDVAGGFSDIADHWAADNILQAARLNLVNGVDLEAGLFEPEGTLLRCQVAVILWRAAGSPAVDASASGFSDVSADAYYAQAVAWASQSGFVNGVGDGLFEPEAPVQREQLAKMIAGFAKTQGVDVDSADTAALQQCADWETASDWALQSLAWTASAGVLAGNGRDGGLYLDPQDEATRAQMAKIIVTALDAVEAAAAEA